MTAWRFEALQGCQHLVRAAKPAEVCLRNFWWDLIWKSIWNLKFPMGKSGEIFGEEFSTSQESTRKILLRISGQISEQISDKISETSQEPRKGVVEGGFCKNARLSWLGALSAKCTAGPNILGYCLLPWAWHSTLQKPPFLCRANGRGGVGSQKLLLTPSGDPEKQTVGTVTTSHKMLTLQALSSSLNAGTAKRGCLGRGKAFGYPPTVCPPKRPRPFAHYRPFAKPPFS